MSAPQIPQPTFPGGGPFGQMPAYQPINVGTPGWAGGYLAGTGTGQDPSTVLGAAQRQDLTAQQIMLKNFAQTYPQLNAAQGAWQSQLGTNTNLTSMLNGYLPVGTGAQYNVIGALSPLMNQTENAASKLTNTTLGLNKMLTGAGGPGMANLGIINNAAQGKYANPLLQSAFGTLTNEASGAQPINPIVQQTMIQSGLAGAAQNLGAGGFMPGGGTSAGGGASGNMGPGYGTTGMAEVAKNLGVSAESYIQNMQNQGLQGIGQLNADVTGPAQSYLGQLGGMLGQVGALQGQAVNQTAALGGQIGGIGGQLVGEAQAQQQLLNQQQATEGAMFPRTQIGLSGSDVSNMLIANTQGQNQFNQANFASQMAAAQYRSSIAGQNAGLSASNSSGLISGGVGIASAAVIAAFCGVAIKVLGLETNAWQSFRHWIHNHASKRIRASYLRALRTGTWSEFAESKLFSRIAREFPCPLLA